MTHTEDRLSRLLHEQTPEPPRPLRLADMERRLTPSDTERARPWSPRAWLAPVAVAGSVIVAVAGVSLLVGSESTPGSRQPGRHASSAPVAGRCAAAALRASVIDGGAEASQPFVIIGLTNTSDSACSLRGYPEVTVRGGSAAGSGPITALPSATIHGVYEHADPGPHLVTISPHRQARFTLGTNTASGGSRQMSEIWRVTISLPGGGGQLPLALTDPMYASGQPLRIGITAVEPGTTGAPASPPPAAAQTGTAVLGEASLSLPRGWVSRTIVADGWPTLCLAPSGASIPQGRQDCPIWFRSLAGSAGQGLDVDDSGGERGGVFPGACSTWQLNGFRVTTLGWRAAGYRRWTVRCGSGRTTTVEQYVVSTGPAYVLRSERSDATISAVLSRLSTSASLPARVTPLPYSYIGTVASVTHRPDGYQVTARQSVSSGGGVLAIPGAPLARFIVPDRLVPAPLSLAGLIGVHTDGFRVTGLIIEGG